MKKFIFEMPLEYIHDALKQATLTVETCAEIDRDEAALPPVSLQKDGENGVAMRKALLEENARRRAVISEIGAREINTLRKDYENALKKQETLSGDALRSIADFDLLRDNIVENEAALEMLAEKHADNYTFLHACREYARVRDWDGFSVISNADDLRTFGTAALDMYENAARNPRGYDAMRMKEEKELMRLAQVCGVLPEYNEAADWE